MFRNKSIANKEIQKRNAIQIPVRGEWKLIKSPGHDQFAFDMVGIEKISHKKLSKSRLQHVLGNVKAEDFYGWNQPVYSPVNGRVVRSSDEMTDRKNLALLKDLWDMFFNQPDLNLDDLSSFAGNHVIIETDEFYVFLAHLKQHSLEVSQGELVTEGQLIGRVGNSGVSLEPHLHFQLFDQIEDLESVKAPPFLINELERLTGGKWERLRDTALQKGNIIRSANY